MGNVETAVEWGIKCWWCKHPFMVSDATKTKDGVCVICPKCTGWSGFDMVKRRPKLENIVEDPGQNRLIGDLWAWIVVDPATNLEGVCGIVVDGSARLAITSNLNEALRLCEHIKALKAGTGKRLKLVHYVQQEVEMDL